MKFRIPSTIKLILWIALVWGIAWFLAWGTDFPRLHWLPLALLGIGLYIYQEKPLRQSGFTQPMEAGVITTCGIIFILYVGWVFLAPRLVAEDLAGQPCSPKTLEMQCYTFSQTNCSSVWEHYSQECTEEIKRTIVSRRSTVLTGPIVRRCIYKSLDQSFRSNRRTPLDDRCQQHFSSLDAPSLE